jgi:hypothetical protein
VLCGSNHIAVYGSTSIREFDAHSKYVVHEPRVTGKCRPVKVGADDVTFQRSFHGSTPKVPSPSHHVTKRTGVTKEHRTGAMVLISREELLTAVDPWPSKQLTDRTGLAHDHRLSRE